MLLMSSCCSCQCFRGIKGRESDEPAACEEGVDPGVAPVVSMHYINILETVEIERLLWKTADESGLEERRPHVLEEPLGPAFIDLQNETNKSQCEDALSLFFQMKIHPLRVT